METVAKFSLWTEAMQALDVVKARGILAAICPEEVHAGMWQGEVHYQVGYQLQVEASQVPQARECLKQIGITVVDEEEE